MIEDFKLLNKPAPNPDKKLAIQHVLRDGDMVAIHSCVKMNPEGQSIALVHLFRFAQGKIEELWDIGQPEPEEMINEHGMF